MKKIFTKNDRPEVINGHFSIPFGYTEIEDVAFFRCGNLTSIEIPASVTSIGRRAFWECERLSSIVIPDSVTSIGEGAFEDCSSLMSAVIPDSVTNIGRYAFSDCTSLDSVNIPNSVSSIEKATFSDCHSLRSVIIPNSVTSIGDEAFRDCKSLADVDIPDSVKEIGNMAFSGSKVRLRKKEAVNKPESEELSFNSRKKNSGRISRGNKQDNNLQSQYELFLKHLLSHEYEQAENCIPKKIENNAGINELKRKIGELKNFSNQDSLDEKTILRELGSMFILDGFSIGSEHLYFDISQYLLKKELNLDNNSSYDVFAFSADCLLKSAELGDAEAQHMYGLAQNENAEVLGGDDWLLKAALQGHLQAIQDYIKAAEDYTGYAEDLEGPIDPYDCWYVKGVIALYEKLSEDKDLLETFKKIYEDSNLSEYAGDAIMEVLSKTYSSGDAIYDYFMQFGCDDYEDFYEDEEDVD